MNCIICGNQVQENSIEHIVPESMGNKHYTLELGSICRTCNNSFSSFEQRALSDGILAMARPIGAHLTKKKKPAKGQSHGIRFEGNPNSIENRVTVFGLNEDNVQEVKPDGSVVVTIQDFEKNVVPVCKLILKIGLESLYQSQRKIFNSTDLSLVKNYLDKKSNVDWPLVTTALKPADFISIPRFRDKLALKKIKCEIRYKNVNAQTLLINFRYNFLSYLVNIVDRNVDWVDEYKAKDPTIGIYSIPKQKSRS